MKGVSWALACIVKMYEYVYGASVACRTFLACVSDGGGTFRVSVGETTYKLAHWGPAGLMSIGEINTSIKVSNKAEDKIQKHEHLSSIKPSQVCHVPLLLPGAEHLTRNIMTRPLWKARGRQYCEGQNQSLARDFHQCRTCQDRLLCQCIIASC